MKYNDIEKILLFLVYNLKGKKKKRDNWITIAEKCKEAIEKVGSLQEVAKRTQTSQQLIQAILKILELPKEIKNLIKERKIGMDIAQRLTKIKNKRTQILIANEVLDLNSKDARDLVGFASKKPNASNKEYKNYKKRLLNAKRKVQNIHLSLLSFDVEDYNKIKLLANKQKLSPEKLIHHIIKNFLSKEEREKL